MQFFSLLNHRLLPLILLKAGFNSKISFFFQDYLVGKKTSYYWNNFFSSSFHIDIGVGQELALSPVLSTLYLSLLFYIFEKWLKNLNIPVSILSFIDNGLFITQNKSIAYSNSNLFYSYKIMTSILKKFSLVIEYEKTEVFHFFRSYGMLNFQPLNLSTLRDPHSLIQEFLEISRLFFQYKINISKIC